MQDDVSSTRVRAVLNAGVSLKPKLTSKQSKKLLIKNNWTNAKQYTKAQKQSQKNTSNVEAEEEATTTVVSHQSNEEIVDNVRIDLKQTESIRNIIQRGWMDEDVVNYYLQHRNEFLS